MRVTALNRAKCTLSEGSHIIFFYNSNDYKSGVRQQRRCNYAGYLTHISHH